MKFKHSFTVPVPVEQTWTVLRDEQRIASCVPGATIDSPDGDAFIGEMKVKIGSITVTYKGHARVVTLDEATHTATIEVEGKEARGSGTVRASVTARLEPRGDETHVALTTDLTVTGRAGQIDRGVIADAGVKLVGRFAECLSSELASAEAAPDDGAVPATQVTEAEAAAVIATPAAEEQVGAAAEHGRRPTAEAIDLFDASGPSVARRLAPVAAILAVLAILALLARRRRS